MTPFDTAWARFRGQERQEAAPPLSKLMGTLAKTSAGFNLDPATPSLAFELASLVPDLSPRQRVALVLLVSTTLADLAQGSTRTRIDDEAGARHLRERFLRLLDASESPPEGNELDTLVDVARGLLTEAAMAPLVGTSDDAHRPLVFVDGWLSHQRTHRAETRLAAALGGDTPVGMVPDPAAVDAALDAVLDAPAGFQLTDEQIHAVRRAVSDRLVFISGGPGTGKTSIVVAILRTLARLGSSPATIGMAAPTGKAAWRMGESVGAGLAAIADPAPIDAALASDLPSPRTLHRLLEYSPQRERFGRGTEVPLEESVVIVDETSMVDVFMMQSLLAAAGPTTRLVFLGDADQLPSVAAGAVFRDAVAGLAGRRVSLTHSFRMRLDDPAGAAILHVADAINAGETSWLADPTSLSDQVSVVSLDAPRSRGVGLAESEGAPLDTFLSWWFDRRVRGEALDPARRHVFEITDGAFADADLPLLDGLFAHTGAARLLCATRVLPEGTMAINRALHDAVRSAMNAPPTARFIPGEPVLMLENDYRREVFNGDQGVVINLRRLGESLLGVAFPSQDGHRVFALDPLADRVEHCYAMTIHKSQGSEFDHVALLLPQATMPLMSRELLYTGVTRSRASVNIIGPREVLLDAIASPLLRTSGLAERLGSAGA